MSRHTVRHLVEQPGAHGPRWFWQPSTKLRALGWRPRRLDGPTLAEAMAQAEAINAELDAWRIQQALGTPAKGRPAAGTVAALIVDYKESRWWQGLAPRTRRDYGWALDAIATWAGDQPVRAITPPAVQAFHAGLARRVHGRGKHRRVIETPAKAAAAVRVLRLLLQVGVRLGYVATNAAARPGIAVQRQREPVLWTAPMLAHMVATADALGWHSQATAMTLNAWIGQRQADVLALPPWQFEAGALVLRQGKRGRKVSLPVHLVPHLVARLQQERARANALASTRFLLLHEGTGQRWNEYTFGHVFAAIRAEAAKTMPECADLRWMELRHSAVTYLHDAGVTEIGIASITGHSVKTVRDLLDRHYLIRTAAGAENAFRMRLAKEGGE